MEEPLQKSLDRYDVLDRIAVGGMAEVFLAKAYGAHGFEKTLAIKRILPELARDPEFEARFIAEAKVAVKLSHANVVQVFDFGRIGETLFIAMEYVDGLDLAALLRKFKDEKRLVPLPAAFHIAIEIIRALDFAHQHGVVHRDVSPSNILLSRAGEVKIGDFGIAVAAQPHRAAGKGPRKVMGKWRYMSPEQARGDTLDTRSDLFSAASVLFELFTGEKLFPGDEAEEITKNIEIMPIPKASSTRTGLPSRLDDILASALARKPIDRPSRPAAVLRSLIELSYESSIMATALDVAEAVAAVLPAKKIAGAAQLDDVIRKQLGAAQDKSVARRTAVTDGKPTATGEHKGEVSTGLFRKLGGDGLSVLEEVDPTEVAAPRARRASESGALKAAELMPEDRPSSQDSAMHRLLDARLDPDRHTEVGGPPTGQAPKLEATGAIPKTPPPHILPEPEPPRSSRRGLVAAIAFVVLAGGGFVAWRALGSHPTRAVAPAAKQDAAAVTAFGTLEIDPDPEGAVGTIADHNGVVASKFGPTSHATPTRLRVEAKKRFHVHFELAGYAAFDDDREVQPDETMVIRPTLAKAIPVLHVTSKPSGAQVTLGGKALGETPLTRSDLEPAHDVELVVSRAGFEPYHVKIDLISGRTTDVDRELKEAQKVGSVTIKLTGTGAAWAEVSFKGKVLGRNKTIDGYTAFRLPTGKQQLRVENPANHKAKTITVNVTESAQTVEVSLD